MEHHVHSTTAAIAEIVFFSFGAVAFLFGIISLAFIVRVFLFFPRVKGKTVAVHTVEFCSGGESTSGATPLRKAMQREVYFAVYEYRTAQGDTIQARSCSADNRIRDKIPGRELWLYVTPGDPSLVERIDGATILSMALMFLVAGYNWSRGGAMPFEPASLTGPALIMLFIILILASSRERRAVAKVNLKEKRARQFQESHQLTFAEIRERVEAGRRNWTKASLFFVIISILMLSDSYLFGLTPKGIMYGAAGIGALLAAGFSFRARSFHI